MLVFVRSTKQLMRRNHACAVRPSAVGPAPAKRTGVGSPRGSGASMGAYFTTGFFLFFLLAERDRFTFAKNGLTSEIRRAPGSSDIDADPDADPTRWLTILTICPV